MPHYIALFKPYGVLSSFTHEAREHQHTGRLPHGTGGGNSLERPEHSPAPKRTLSEFGLPKGIYAAGRLDYDSEGLLILSDDGAFIHRLTDPKHKLPKTYLAQVEGVPSQEALLPFRRGLQIKDYRTLPCQARILDDEPALPPRDKPITPHGPTTWLELVLTEGKKRQVRHMTAAVGLPTLRLVRVQIGPVNLAGLMPGKWRDLSQSELDSIIRTHTTNSLKSSPRQRPRRKKDRSNE
jgi:23S rRNA pseudouridine2457 synthase